MSIAINSEQITKGVSINFLFYSRALLDDNWASPQTRSYTTIFAQYLQSIGINSQRPALF